MRGRTEAALDATELLATAAWKVEWFARQKELSGESLTQMMPRTKHLTPQEEYEIALAKMDAWAEGTVKRFGPAKASHADH